MIKDSSNNRDRRQETRTTSQNAKDNQDLKERCYQFSLDVIELTNDLPQKQSAWTISDQLIRSSTSIGANLVEGKSASSKKEFKRFNEIALKSANETKYWLGLLRDTELADKDDCNQALEEVKELSKMIASDVKKMKEDL